METKILPFKPREDIKDLTWFAKWIEENHTRFESFVFTAKLTPEAAAEEQAETIAAYCTDSFFEAIALSCIQQHTLHRAHYEDML